jgi:predicted O-linked N-acetylglucosamine transferase (SPINDLY family)
MQQLIRVLELHDRDTFEICAYSYGPPANDAMRGRVRKAVQAFHDVRNLSAKEIAQRARQDRIDIAIDLVGHTKNGRPEIFAYRAAPLQITWLGYPGTVGGGLMDYMIADSTVIPDEQRAHYAEKIIFLPHSYLPTDNTRPIADTPPTRRDMGLPDKGFVFACFNNSYKISPAEFDIWMRLLHQVDGSVLWLAGGNDQAQANLAEEARQRGIDPARVIFTRRVGMAEHLARHRLADLFLDSFLYNGHSTAADALWAGLPVLTCPGRGFPSRVAASLLSAIGLPELIAQTPQEYERLALELAQNPARLAALKQRLDANKARAPLFDSENFTKNLEAGYRLAYGRFLTGEKQGDIIVKESGAA